MAKALPGANVPKFKPHKRTKSRKARPNGYCARKRSGR